MEVTLLSTRWCPTFSPSTVLASKGILLMPKPLRSPAWRKGKLPTPSLLSAGRLPSPHSCPCFTRNVTINDIAHVTWHVCLGFSDKCVCRGEVWTPGAWGYGGSGHSTSLDLGEGGLPAVTGCVSSGKLPCLRRTKRCCQLRKASLEPELAVIQAGPVVSTGWSATHTS